MLFPDQTILKSKKKHFKSLTDGAYWKLPFFLTGKDPSIGWCLFKWIVHHVTINKTILCLIIYWYVDSKRLTPHFWRHFYIILSLTLLDAKCRLSLIQNARYLYFWNTFFKKYYWNPQAIIYQCIFNLHDCTFNGNKNIDIWKLNIVRMKYLPSAIDKNWYGKAQL